MQTVTPGRMKIADAPFAGGFGEYDLWDLWLLDEAEDVPCESIRNFLYYLCSRGTKHCEFLNDRALTTGSVDVRLTGPLADDERNHLLRYRLTRVDIAKLKEAEKNLLVTESGGRTRHPSLSPAGIIRPVGLRSRSTRKYRTQAACASSGIWEGSRPRDFGAT